MEPRKSYDLIRIGLCIRLLLNTKKTDSKKFILEHIKMLLRDLNKISFPVSTAGAFKLKNVEELLDKLENDQEIGTNIAEEITREMDLLERVIYSESMTKIVYLIPERRFNSEYLINSPSRLFKDGIFEKFSEIARYDITCSCRCMLFGEATASAFHILRATEDTLKQYYFLHKKQKRLKNPMWGPMTNELRAKKTNKPPKVLLDSLDMVRNSYRNPTQHPEAKYDINEAQDLFGICLDSMSKMASEF